MTRYIIFNQLLEGNHDPKRQRLIDSWPSKLNQTSAINDWNWSPKYNFDSAFDHYLIPKIKEYYKK